MEKLLRNGLDDYFCFSHLRNNFLLLRDDEGLRYGFRGFSVKCPVAVFLAFRVTLLRNAFLFTVDISIL